MSFFSNLLPSRKTSANTAKERLQIVIAHERRYRGGPDYLPLLETEILEVIRKYVHVDADAVNINVEREDAYERLELNVLIPDRSGDDGR